MRNKRLLVPTYEYQKYFVSHSFSVCPITTKLWHKLQLGITKTLVVKKPSIFDRKKVIEFERWILTDFWLENWVKIHISNSITFCIVKTKGILTARFFCHSKLYVMSNFSGDRMSRKNMRNKKLLIHTYEYQKFFVSHSFSVCPITTKLWHKLQLGITKQTCDQPTFYLWPRKVIEFERLILTDF